MLMFSWNCRGVDFGAKDLRGFGVTKVHCAWETKYTIAAFNDVGVGKALADISIILEFAAAIGQQPNRLAFFVR